MALKPRYSFASKLAQKLLTDSKTKYPPVELDSILEHLGIKKLPYKFPKHVSAVLMKMNAVTVIGVNQEHPPARQRFSIAHEIGHFMLGHHTETIVDSEEISEGRFDITGENKLQEQEANCFASELLMPIESLKQEFAKLKNAKTLSELYNVSEQALWIRLMHLKLV